MPVIYIDVLFLINFIMDSILLVITGRVSGEKITAWRILSGGILGGLYSISVFFAPLSFMSAGIVKLAVSAIMVFITYGLCSVKSFLRILLCFYLSSFLLGGGLAALYYFSGRPGIMSNGIYYFPLSIFQLFLIGLPLGLVLGFYFEKSKNRLMQLDKYCTVTICFGEKTLVVESIVDTGCSLVDPCLNVPVIIIDPKMAKTLLQEDYKQLLMDLHKLRLIPYSTISVSDSFLCGFTPDKVFINSNGTKSLYSCTVAVSPDCLGGKAIINPDVFTHQI